MEDCPGASGRTDTVIVTKTMCTASDKRNPGQSAENVVLRAGESTKDIADGGGGQAFSVVDGAGMTEHCEAGESSGVTTSRTALPECDATTHCGQESAQAGSADAEISHRGSPGTSVALDHLPTESNLGETVTHELTYGKLHL